MARPQRARAAEAHPHPLLLASACLLAASALLGPRGASAQFGMPPGMGGPPEKPAPAVPADIPFVQCQVCQLVVKEAVRLTDDLRKEAAAKPGKKLEEADIIEKLERICAPADDAGEWATRVDFVESGAKLKVTDTGKPSKCNSECATAARACERAVEALDLSDVSEALYRRLPLSEIAAQACGEEGDGEGRACSTGAPPVPKGRKAGPKHEPMEERELQMAKMMRQLKASGMGGQMFDRNALMKNKKMMKRMAAGGGMGGGEEDDEDDEDNEDEGEGEGGGGGGGDWDAEGAPSAAPSVKAALGAGAAKVDEIAARAKDTLGGAIGWLKGKVAGGGGGGGGSGGGAAAGGEEL